MAIKRRMPVEHSDAFPEGAYLVGEVEPVADFNAAQRADGSRPQAADPESGLLVCRSRSWMRIRRPASGTRR